MIIKRYLILQEEKHEKKKGTPFKHDLLKTFNVVNKNSSLGLRKEGKKRIFLQSDNSPPSFSSPLNSFVPWPEGEINRIKRTPRAFLRRLQHRSQKKKPWHEPRLLNRYEKSGRQLRGRWKIHLAPKQPLSFTVIPTDFLEDHLPYARVYVWLPSLGRNNWKSAFETMETQSRFNQNFNSDEKYFFPLGK